MVAKHKQKRLAEEWDLDMKPPKKYRRHVSKAERQFAKSQIRRLKLQTGIEDEEELLEQLNQESDEAMYCYRYGPCRKCQEAKESRTGQTDMEQSGEKLQSDEQTGQ